MIKRKGNQIDKLTREWIKNPGDELAAQKGCRFDGERGQFAIDWMEHYLRLYEGEFAGQPFLAGDWQRDFLMRLFSWVRHDEEWSKRKGKETWVRRFTEATVIIAKKNAKSPTLAAVGLYLTCGDGEMGGKSFFFAKDGKQSREIAGKHAVEMLRQSVELMAECSIDKVRCQITHEPTRSILVPASSGDDRSQKANEGLNGNILIDELHVVDRRLINRVSRAGISRMEPLMLQVSTAGDDPDSYGKERVDYCLDVLDGRVTDQRLLACIYAAPQDLSDTQLDEDPLKYGRMANPTMGRIVREDEYLSDYQTSKRAGPTSLSIFKMYRLNIWQHGSSPLLDNEGWDKGKQRYTLQELAGLGGGLGIDLSKNEDMSACVFVVPWGEQVRLWPMFWIAEEYARANNHLASFLDWGLAGHLKIVPAMAITDDDILPDLIEAIETIQPGMACFDPTYATALALKLEGATSCEMVAFSQGFPAYSNPTVEFRDAVREGDILHPGNDVLSWQARHVAAIERGGMLKPIKDKKHRHRKIDGIQAAIMAWHAYKTKPESFRSVYEERGPLIVCGDDDEMY